MHFPTVDFSFSEVLLEVANPWSNQKMFVDEKKI